MATQENETLDGDLRMRISQKELEVFKQKAPRISGKEYQVLVREMITAFNDGRLRIVQTEEQKRTHGELYQ